MIDNLGSKIKGGLLTAFAIILIIVGSVATFYMLQYIYGITLGSMFSIAVERNQSYPDTSHAFIGTNGTNVSVGYPHLIPGTLTITNASNDFQITLGGNFTVYYDDGLVTLNDSGTLGLDGATFLANYSYWVYTSPSITVSDTASTFFSATETGFLSSMGTLRISMNFALGLVIVSIVLLVFGTLILGYIYNKKKNKDMGY